MVRDPAAPLLLHLPAGVPGKAAAGLPGSWPQPDPAVNKAATWGSEQAGGRSFCVSLFFCNSEFQTNRIILTKEEEDEG